MWNVTLGGVERVEVEGEARRLEAVGWDEAVELASESDQSVSISVSVFEAVVVEPLVTVSGEEANEK